MNNPDMGKKNVSRTPNPFSDMGDGSEDDATFYSLGTEFLEAARVLMETPPTRLGYRFPIYYLIGHAAELFLKAYLFRNGESIETLKDSGHDLAKLLKNAKQKGLAWVDEAPQLKKLSRKYKGKIFEYRANRQVGFPPIEGLFGEAKRLEATVVK